MTGMSGRQAVKLPTTTLDRQPPAISFFEFWPGWIFYTPVVIHWLLLGLRHMCWSLPTAANPRITTGGLCGESKLSILDQAGPGAEELIAPAIGILARPAGGDAAETAMRDAGLAWPVVAKPDIGCNGTGVRLLRGRDDLDRYIRDFPAGETIVLQRFIEAPNEAGLFYVRHPDEARGRITSVTLKHPPVVVGDGRSTLRQLILDDPRAGKVSKLYLPRLEGRLDSVPAQGETVQLVFVGNHCKGSVFEDGSAMVTPALTDAVDRLAKSLPDFHFGRIDVRYETLARLRQGEGFTVIEINGVGSEATHIWDPRTTLWAAWKTQFFHYGSAFRIGAANRRRGFSPSSVMTMYRDWMRQRRLMASYPMND